MPRVRAGNRRSEGAVTLERCRARASGGAAAMVFEPDQACRPANDLLIRRRALQRHAGSLSRRFGRERRAQGRYRPWDAVGGDGWRDRSSPPSDTTIPPPTRSPSVSDSSCLGYIMPGSTLWVARRAGDRQHARHDRGAFGLVTGLWRSNECRPANGLQLPASRWWMPVLAASASAGGVMSSFPRRVARCRPSPWLRSLGNPDAGPATQARCRSVLSPTGYDAPRWRG